MPIDERSFLHDEPPRVDDALYDAGGAVFNVRSARFGAVGDGVASDGAAFQGAIDAAFATGGTVFVPAGTYRLDRTLVLATRVSLVGVGHASFLFFDPPLDGPGLNGGPLEQASVRRLRIGGRTARAIHVSGATRFTLAECDVSGATLGAAEGVRVEDSTDVAIVGNRFHGNGTGTAVPVGADVQLGGADARLRVTGARIEGNTAESVRVAVNVLLYNAVSARVTSNRIRGARADRAAAHHGYGIAVYRLPGAPPERCRGNVIADNAIERTEGSGIYLAAATDCIVHGNVVSDVATALADTQLPVGGIALNGCERVAVSGNVVRGSGRDGIVVSGNVDRARGIDLTAREVALAGNVVSGIEGTAIRLRGTVEGVSVTGSVVADARYGIGYAFDEGAQTKTRVAAVGNAVSTRARSQGQGIALRGASGATVVGNALGPVGGTGIELRNPPATAGQGDNVVVGNAALESALSASGGQFAAINVETDRTVVAANRAGSPDAPGKAGVGLRVRGAASAVVANLAVNNARVAIDAPGVGLVVGNHAYNNGRTTLVSTGSGVSSANLVIRMPQR